MRARGWLIALLGVVCVPLVALDASADTASLGYRLGHACGTGFGIAIVLAIVLGVVKLCTGTVKTVSKYTKDDFFKPGGGDE
jgi:hypothetical protein